MVDTARRSLNTPYSAYYYRDVPQEDEELTHVGPGTPCGEYFRRYWLPVELSAELKDLPRRIRILGEDLVVFRDRSGPELSYPIRFLEARLRDDTTVDLDFNRAYNPPCAFTPHATCPMPPPQNHLPVSIEAGERTTE